MVSSLSSLPKRSDRYDCGLKRVIDVLCSLTALIVLSPLLLFILLLVLLFQPGSPIFCQRRIGYQCKPFHIYKFRTMVEAEGEEGEPLPDEMRETWLGRQLRRTSLDELPELVNILLGDMSLIGPRPWIPEQMATFSPRTQRKRMSVRPGLSGLAQVLGRNNLTFRQRVCWDIYYIHHECLITDIMIVFYTIYKLFKQEGIYQRPDALSGNGAVAPPKDEETKGKRGNQPRPKHHTA